MKPGDTCYIAVTGEMLHDLLHTGREPEGYVRCVVLGLTESTTDRYDLEDTREPDSPAGIAPWGSVPERLLLSEIPEGGKELT